jgi:hypothetical protein
METDMSTNPSASASPAPRDVDDLVRAVLRGEHGPDPAEQHAVGAFWVRQSTQFPGTEHKYRNYYLVLRVGAGFGGCCLERDQLPSEIAEELSGRSVAELLVDPRAPVRIAALDAYLCAAHPHRDDPRPPPMLWPPGTPLQRAEARDRAIAGLLDIVPGQRVGLIGVVNPLVAAIRAHGGTCLPCDFNMATTADGTPVVRDMRPVLETADMIVATGMTLGNGSFDTILAAVRRRGIPFVVYAQTGSAIVPRFLGHGVTGISAEPFPFSQFSADPTPIHLYRHAASATRAA